MKIINIKNKAKIFNKKIMMIVYKIQITIINITFLRAGVKVEKNNRFKIYIKQICYIIIIFKMKNKNY